MKLTISKSIHFSGQPLFNRIIKLLNKSKTPKISRDCEGERYVKQFDDWTHTIMILRDSLIFRAESLKKQSLFD
ncbi:MAG: DUF4372 domain-containing protein [Bacteroidales bacterium]|nr:DUF4372 domain-containing protein [Bacteroidales bacterium]